jgi:hypothetical protein
MEIIREEEKIITNTKSENFIEFKKMQEHNEKIINEVPNLINVTALTVGNHFYIPSVGYEVIPKEIDLDYYKGITIDEDLMFYTKINVDNNDCFIHQHVFNLFNKPKNVQPTNALNFNLNTIKKFFYNSTIPLSFKQNVVLLAINKKDPEILSIAFEDEERQIVENLFYESVKKLT